MSSNNQDLDSSDLLIVLDLEVFHRQAQLSRLKDETAAHSLMVDYGGGDNLLRHPLAETFMHMKWNMVKRFFYINVTMYTAFVISLTALAVTATSIVKDYTEEMHRVNMTPVEYDGLPMKECLDATEAGAKQNTFWTFLVITLIGTVVLTIREVLINDHKIK